MSKHIRFILLLLSSCLPLTIYSMIQSNKSQGEIEIVIYEHYEKLMHALENNASLETIKEILDSSPLPLDLLLNPAMTDSYYIENTPLAAAILGSFDNPETDAILELLLNAGARFTGDINLTDGMNFLALLIENEAALKNKEMYIERVCRAFPHLLYQRFYSTNITGHIHDLLDTNFGIQKKIMGDNPVTPLEYILAINFIFASSDTDLDIETNTEVLRLLVALHAEYDAQLGKENFSYAIQNGKLMTMLVDEIALVKVLNPSHVLRF